jgi:predicted TIM-barrel fold metal-dependent hydrolase
LVGASDFGPEYGFLGPGGLGFPFTYMMTMTHLIMGGTMDQFPELRFGFFEAGAGWLPYLMNRLDTYYVAEQRQGRAKGEVIPRHLPSSYFNRFFVTAMSKETYLGDTVRAIPDHRIIVGTDFPHQDPNSTWPDTLSELRSIEGLDDEDLRRMLDTNARSLLGM